ncbi:MAG: DUF2231 domain-containing protein [Steroidobacteraceae bacterium]|jgi:uncharacterized membrane protein
MIAASEWHPIAVHFPLALVTTGAAALGAARLWERRRATLATIGTWNLCLGAFGALVALATGLAALASVEIGAAARAAVGLHVKWAIFTTVGVLLLAVWRTAGAAQDSRPSRWFLGVLWALVAALIVTGYRGGQNVYRYGVGVTRAAAAAGPSSQE